MGQLLATATWRGTLKHIRRIEPVPPAASNGLVSAVYQAMARDFGMLAPPIALHARAPIVMAAAWTILRETLLADAVAGRQAKEAVATAVSLANSCTYCVDIHGSALDGLAGVRDQAVPELPAFTTGDERTPELIGVAVTFQYLNRMVNLFLVGSPFPQGLPAFMRRPVRWGAARVAGALARRRCHPGLSARLLPAAELPEDLHWTLGQPHIAEAFARAVAAIEAASAIVPDSVRELLHAQLAAWRGQPPGLGRAWLEEPIARLPHADRAAGRLALMTAFASGQVSDADIEAARDRAQDDAWLLTLTSWSSLAAARRIGQWLAGELP